MKYQVAKRKGLEFFQFVAKTQFLYVLLTIICKGSASVFVSEPLCKDGNTHLHYLKASVFLLLGTQEGCFTGWGFRGVYVYWKVSAGMG